MFHVVFALTSRFLYLRNLLQGFARGILALRSLDAISSHLTPALSPPPPVPLLDAPVPFMERPEQIILPYPSRDVIAIQRQFPVFASPFPLYQSSLIAVTPSHFPKFLPVFVILAVISGFVVVLPEIASFFANIVKSFKSKPMVHSPSTNMPSQFASSKLPISLVSLLLLWTGPPAIATLFSFVWFTSILFSYEPVSNTITAILQWCGLSIVQDTRTPPLLDAIYEQIKRGAPGYSDLVRSDEDNKYQVITDYSLGYSHLEAQLSAHELHIQSSTMRKENQEPEVSIQRIYPESIDSQSFHRQLELSRAREQKLDAYLLASEQERERLKALVSTLDASCRNQQGWKEIAGVAKSLYLESETTAFNLREDLAAATDRVRSVQEQLDHQRELASDKDGVIKSITKESRLAQTRFRIERDRRLRETKEFLREKAMARDRIRRLTHDAQNAQEQLDALRNTLSQHRDHPPNYQPPATWPYDTGRPPLPPECSIDTDTPPVSSAIDPDSSRCDTKFSSRLPIHDSSTHLAALLLEIPGFCDQESKVAKEQRAALAELIERVRQVELESAEDVKPNERDETRLQEELIATKEQLRLAEEVVLDLRRELGQSKESLCEMETHARSLESELGICQATVREAQDAQYATEVKFTEATQLLRAHQAESKSSTASAEESQSKCSQATFLCTALQERVIELEAKVKKLKEREFRANSKSRSRHSTGVSIDLEAVAHDPGNQESDSFYITVPPSMFCLLDLSLPTSSPSNDSSLYLSHQEYPTIPSASTNSGSDSRCPTNPDPKGNTHDTDAQTFDSIVMSPECLPCPLDLPSPPSLSQSSTSPFCFSRQMRAETSSICTDSHSSSREAILDPDVNTPSVDSDSQIFDSSPPQHASTKARNFSLPPFILPRTFLSERSSLGSVDWPPIGSSLLPEHGNARQDDNLSPISPTEGDDSILLCRVLSPVKELDEVEVLETHTPLDRDKPVVSDDDRRSSGLSHTPDTPPIWPPSSPQFPIFPIAISDLQGDPPVTPVRGRVTRNKKHRDHVSEPPSSRIAQLPLPVFPRISLPRFSLSPSGIHKLLGRQLESSEPETTAETQKSGASGRSSCASES